MSGVWKYFYLTLMLFIGSCRLVDINDYFLIVFIWCQNGQGQSLLLSMMSPQTPWGDLASLRLWAFLFLQTCWQPLCLPCLRAPHPLSPLHLFHCLPFKVRHKTVSTSKGEGSIRRHTESFRPGLAGGGIFKLVVLWVNIWSTSFIFLHTFYFPLKKRLFPRYKKNYWNIVRDCRFRLISFETISQRGCDS